MRTACALALLLLLAGCSRGGRNDRDAIRQGVIDHLAGTNLNIAAMDVDVTSVKYDGGKADVMVTFRAKGAGAGAPGMEMRYQMQQQGDRWAVTGTQDSGHSSQAPPGTANPHGGGALPPGHPTSGGAAPPPGQGGAMPSPEDLPPVKK